MRAEREEQRSAELLGLLGEAGFLRLVEAYGGTRLFVPVKDLREITTRLGKAAAEKLAKHHAGSYLRVPLARALRARHYRAGGMSNAQIARRLGLTETGVDKLFARMTDRPAKGSGDPRQFVLFSD